MHAKITAYKGKLVCELLARQSIPGEVATSIDNPMAFGQVILNTEKNLGVSAEALEILRSLKVGQDDLGDVDWFRTNEDKACFGWAGGPYALHDAKSETSSSYQILEHIVIPNEVPVGAIQAIDEL